MPRRHYHLHDAAQEKDMPLKWHEAPRWEQQSAARIVTGLYTPTHVSSELLRHEQARPCTIRVTSKPALKLISSGQTCAFRDAMDEVRANERMLALYQCVLQSVLGVACEACADIAL